MEQASGVVTRSCSHSGCRWPAAASLSFAYATRNVWLEDLTPNRRTGTYDLCSTHAERFRPPQGWDVDDRRQIAQSSPA